MWCREWLWWRGKKARWCVRNQIPNGSKILERVSVLLRDLNHEVTLIIVSTNTHTSQLSLRFFVRFDHVPRPDPSHPQNYRPRAATGLDGRMARILRSVRRTQCSICPSTSPPAYTDTIRRSHIRERSTSLDRTLASIPGSSTGEASEQEKAAIRRRSASRCFSATADHLGMRVCDMPDGIGILMSNGGSRVHGSVIPDWER